MAPQINAYESDRALNVSQDFDGSSPQVRNTQDSTTCTPAAPPTVDDTEFIAESYEPPEQEVPTQQYLLGDPRRSEDIVVQDKPPENNPGNLSGATAHAQSVQEHVTSARVANEAYRHGEGTGSLESSTQNNSRGSFHRPRRSGLRSSTRAQDMSGDSNSRETTLDPSVRSAADMAGAERATGKLKPAKGAVEKLRSKNRPSESPKNAQKGPESDYELPKDSRKRVAPAKKAGKLIASAAAKRKSVKRTAQQKSQAPAQTSASHSSFRPSPAKEPAMDKRITRATAGNSKLQSNEEDRKRKNNSESHEGDDEGPGSKRARHTRSEQQEELGIQPSHGGRERHGSPLVSSKSGQKRRNAGIKEATPFSRASNGLTASSGSAVAPHVVDHTVEPTDEYRTKRRSSVQRDDSHYQDEASGAGSSMHREVSDKRDENFDPGSVGEFTNVQSPYKRSHEVAADTSGTFDHPQPISDNKDSSSGLESSPKNRGVNVGTSEAGTFRNPQTPATVLPYLTAPFDDAVITHTTRKEPIVVFDKSGPRNQGAFPNRTPGARSSRGPVPATDANNFKSTWGNKADVPSFPSKLTRTTAPNGKVRRNDHGGPSLSSASALLKRAESSNVANDMNQAIREALTDGKTCTTAVASDDLVQRTANGDDPMQHEATMALAQHQHEHFVSESHIEDELARHKKRKPLTTQRYQANPTSAVQSSPHAEAQHAATELSTHAGSAINTWLPEDEVQPSPVKPGISSIHQSPQEEEVDPLTTNHADVRKSGEPNIVTGNGAGGLFESEPRNGMGDLGVQSTYSPIRKAARATVTFQGLEKQAAPSISLAEEIMLPTGLSPPFPPQYQAPLAPMKGSKQKPNLETNSTQKVVRNSQLKPTEKQHASVKQVIPQASHPSPDQTRLADAAGRRQLDVLTARDTNRKSFDAQVENIDGNPLPFSTTSAPPKRSQRTTPYDYAEQSVPKQKRRVSQESQTVDAQGSPAPPEMTLGNSRTVLETYTRGSSPSSDQGSSFSHGRGFSPSEIKWYFHDGGRSLPLSNNAKTGPAAPRAQSAAISHLLVSEKESKRLFEDQHTVADLEDPFGRTHGNIRGAIRGLPPPADSVEQHPSEQDEVEASNLPQSKLGKDVERLRCFHVPPQTTAPSEEETDLEETLVEPEEPVSGGSSAKDPNDLPGSADYYRDEDGGSPPPADLMDWTKTLQSRHVNLFDQLVKCAQRLTAYLIHEEKDAAHLLQEWHRRNAYLVEQQQRQHAKHYAHLQGSLRERITVKKEELTGLSRVLDDMAHSFQAEKLQQEAEAVERHAFNEDLEQYIRDMS